MARDHASLRIDIWNDDHFRSLTMHAQFLYLQLLSSATLSYAGVADWRPVRLAALSSDATKATVQRAADELAGQSFIVVDDETEEVLIRSFLKHDGLLHKPNVTKAMVTAFSKIASPTLRGVIVWELSKLHDRHPEWKGFSAEGVAELLDRGSVDPSTLVPDAVGKGLSKGSVKGSQSDPSLLTTNSLLLATNSTHPATSTNEVRDDVMSLCRLLSDLMVSNGDKEPRITQAWMDAARLMLDKDGRDYEASHRLLRWALNDSFWKANIQSMPKFRDKFDQLRHDANRKLEQRQQQSSRGTRRDDELLAFMTRDDNNDQQQWEIEA